MKKNSPLTGPASSLAPHEETTGASPIPRALTPKLRFPEFQNDAEWKPISLGDASVPVDERVGERRLTPVSISAGIGFVAQSEKFGRDISGNQYKLYTIVRDGDFVYNKGNSLKFPQGCVYQLRGWGEVAAPNVFICFRLKKGYSDGFFQSLFEKNAHGIQLKRNITSGARSNGLLNISRDIFFSVKFPVPSLPEQKKIADCLNALDDLIAVESQKLDALNAHKLGLMQRLFPRDGESIPRLRFPEFQGCRVWEKLPLSEFILSLDAGVSVNAGDRPAREGEVGVLKTSAVTNDYFRPDQNKVVLSDEERSRLREPVRAGTIIICRKNTPSLVGANAYIETNHDDIFLPDLLWSAKPREGVSMRFLSYILGSPKGRAAFAKLAKGSSASMSNITKPDVLAVSIMAPSPAEQHRIAACLSSVDGQIAAQSDKLCGIRNHRQGLLQHLFPSSAEFPV